MMAVSYGRKRGDLRTKSNRFFASNGFVRLHDPLRWRPYLTAMMSDLGDLGSNAYVGIAELPMHQQTLPSDMISAHYHVFCLLEFFAIAKEPFVTQV